MIKAVYLLNFALWLAGLVALWSPVDNYFVWTMLFWSWPAGYAGGTALVELLNG